VDSANEDENAGTEALNRGTEAAETGMRAAEIPLLRKQAEVGFRKTGEEQRRQNRICGKYSSRNQFHEMADFGKYVKNSSSYAARMGNTAREAASERLHRAQENVAAGREGCATSVHEEGVSAGSKSEIYSGSG
jgi:hypothetical protein